MRSASLLPAAALVAVLAAGCGRENPALIPRADADDLIALVDEAGTAVQEGQCDAAREAVAAARRKVSELPRRVDRDLEDNLVAWLQHLDRQIETECTAATEPTPTPSATQTPEASPTETPEATPTGTPEATPTATPEATPEPGGGTEEPGGGSGVPGGEG